MSAEKIRKIQNANDWMRKLIDKQLTKTCAKTDRAILIAGSLHSAMGSHYLTLTVVTSKQPVYVN
jgi:hypothetical protein